MLISTLLQISGSRNSLVSLPAALFPSTITDSALPLKREEEQKEDEFTAVHFIIDFRIQVIEECLLARHCRASRS